MDTKKLSAKPSELAGRKVKTLRTAGILPGNVYGKGIKSISLQVDLAEFMGVYKEAGETGIVTLEIGKESKPVLIGNLQVNAKTDAPIHVDFRQVDLKEKIEANVPVTLVGESPAEKQSLGTVVLQLNEIHVSALPADLPEKFDVSVDGLTEVDQAIFVKDLSTDKKVEILSDMEAIVAKVEPPQKEEVIEIVDTPVEGDVPGEPTESATATGEIPPESTEKK